MPEVNSKFVCRKCGRDQFKNRFSFTAHLRFCGKTKAVKAAKAAATGGTTWVDTGVAGALLAEAGVLRKRADRLEEMAKELQTMG